MTPIDLGLLLVRVAVGLTFAAHGAQKVFGWWEGPGFDKWTAGIARMGLRPSWFWAAVSAGAEAVGGPLLILGLVTPAAAALLVAQSVYIVLRVHLARGFFNGKGGIEFPLQLLAGALLVTLAGPGALSIDGAFGLRSDETTRAAMLAIALAGALVAMVVARPQPQPTRPA